MDAESQLLADLDAEIDRLKALVETLRAANASFEGGMHWRNGLITELCDALETRLPFARVGVEAIDAEFDLVHRAREATR
jgi:hypothetical protein